MELPFSQRGKRAIGNMHFLGETQNPLDRLSDNGENNLKALVLKKL